MSLTSLVPPGVPSVRHSSVLAASEPLPPPGPVPAANSVKAAGMVRFSRASKLGRVGGRRVWREVDLRPIRRRIQEKNDMAGAFRFRLQRWLFRGCFAAVSEIAAGDGHHLHFCGEPRLYPLLRRYAVVVTAKSRRGAGRA